MDASIGVNRTKMTKLNQNQINKALSIRERDIKPALNLLRDLDNEEKRKKYETVPPEYIPKTKFEDKTSNGLTACILRWMHLNGHYATRVTTTGRKLPNTTVTDVIGRARVMQGTWIPGTTRIGTADIHAVIAGMHCSIEVKIGRDVMSEAQHQTKEDIEQSGGLYFVAKDFESFMNFYNSRLKPL